MSNQYPQYPSPEPPPLAPEPQKSHKIRNAVLGTVAAIALVSVGAAVGGSGNDGGSPTTKAPAAGAERDVQPVPEAEPEAAPEPEPVEEEPAPAEEAPEETASQEAAVTSAQSYVDLMGFSKDGLVDQLKYEKFSQADAEYGAENVNADWNAEAVESAESYMDLGGFSRASLIDQLIFEKFTQAQAEYAVDKVGL